ncbi:MAG: S41 family peptidase [Caldilineaceae bacterium]
MPTSRKKQILAGVPGYYRYPTIHHNTLVFTAEGDLWKVNRKGGLAQRLTTHHGCESHAAISPDGRTLAFSAQYEGPTEVYTMPLQGGLPTRRTYEGEIALAVGWTPDGKLLYSTEHYSTLPNRQLATIDPVTQAHCLIPLSQASDGVFTPDGSTLFFTRLPFQGSHAKRYKGGTAQNIWKFTFPTPKQTSQAEAIPLTSDYAGTSKTPMWWAGRIYFASDRNGTMNLWSMDEDGHDLRQHTFHQGWDIQSPALHQGRIVYQLGADLYVFEVATGADQKATITLASDFDQTRERWIKNPMEYLSTLHLAPAGENIVLTARGRVFVAPAKQGRLVEVTRKQGIRYRNARFMPDGKALLMLSDESGESEFWTAPPNGIGEHKRLSHDGRVFRYEGVPSPDGQWIAYDDKDQQLWLLNVADQSTRRVAVSEYDEFYNLTWSPDSTWLAYVVRGQNDYCQIRLYSLHRQITLNATSDRVPSFSPAWSPDGKWLYFLSNRQANSPVDKPTKIYMLALIKGLRWPFQPADEVYLAQQQAPAAQETKGSSQVSSSAEPASASAENPSERATSQPEVPQAASQNNNPVGLQIDEEGLLTRLFEAPLPASNYSELRVNGKALFWREWSNESGARLVALEIKNQHITPVTLLNGVTSYELALDGKKLLMRRNNTLWVIDAAPEAPKELDKCLVNLNNWTFSLQPREEWEQMLQDAWRLARDYFYDPGLHGVDWTALRQKYLPLVSRVTERAELNDLIGQMFSELSALHTTVRTSDLRRGADQIDLASLGARLGYSPTAGGYVIQQIYQTDPDYPNRRAPLASAELNLQEGDIIEAINGVPTVEVAHPAVLLKNQAGYQVLLRVKAAATQQTSDYIVRPISPGRAVALRYEAWQYKTRRQVEKLGKGQIGYTHLSGMDDEDYNQWLREYQAVYQRSGLIIDVRHNTGGHIASWILEKLLRKAWSYKQPRIGKPYGNMRLAFQGHCVVLCNEKTHSNAEIFAEGFRRLGLGKVIGMRTWGGTIGYFPDSDNKLVDHGLVRTGQIGMYSPEGEWLIEGHGVEPDIVVDNLPHAAFLGQDAQLEAAIAYLQDQLREKPVVIPPPPPYPNKAFRYDE